MAYLVWKVFMKKYTQVRLGLRGFSVTPTTQQAIAYDEESWKSKLEEDLKEQPFVRSTEVRESRTKKVKKYLKKCKNVLGRSNSTDHSTGESSSVSSWYVDEDPLAIITNTSEINEISEDYEEAQVSLDLGKCSGVYQTAVANIILVKKPEGVEECLDVREEEKTQKDASPPLQNVQGQEDELQKKLEEHEVDEDCPMMKTDVASLVDKYFGELYENYYNSRNCLVRQARDLLVCQYHGCLQTFENEFCIQAAKLLQYLKVQSSGPNSLLGWPLCIGQSGIVIHLSPLDPSAVRNSDCYLCLTSRPPKGLEVTLTWRQNLGIQHHTIAHFDKSSESIDAIMCSNIRSVSDLEMHSYDDYDGSELPGLLQNLLVSVERAIERVPLDDLTFPCPQCLQYLPLDREDETSTCACQCSCKPLSMVLNNASKKDTSIQTSPMLEFAASIPHIDSDTEDDKESIKSGIIRLEVVRPKIADLPEKLLMCGINLPGTFDVDGRPIIVCNALTISKAGLNKYEIAKLLLYYSTIPPAKTVDRGFTVLLIASNELDLKILQLFDKSTSLIENYVRVCNYLIWRPGIKTTEEKCNINHISTITITNKSTLEKYVSKNQMPVVCGGTSNHNQQEWVEFHRILEPFFESCKSTGQSLLATLSRLRNEEIPTPVTRKFLNHQCRQISKTLQMDCLKKIRSEGRSVLSSLEKSKAVGTNADVKRSLDFAEESFNAVDKVAKRLEQLEKERRERLKELIKFRATDSEITELTNWTETEAELTLNKLILTLRCAENAKEVRDISHDFEQFFFSAWKKVEKSSDLNEECKNITDTKCDSVKKSCENLKQKMKIFREKLEETRIQIENSSRCFLLLESCNDILEDDNKEQEGFVKLGMNSGNNKLEELCKSVEGQTRTKTPTQPPDKENPDPGKYMVTSTPIKPNAQIRRRSISSHAYIYHCSHHAAGEVCNCEESDNESTSLSYKLKKKYLQLQTCCSNNVTKDFLERKNSATLGGIKEESTENLLDKTDFKHNECKRCDSGVSTGDEGNFSKSKLQRNCSCHCCRQSCIMCSAASSSSDSTPDQTEKDSILEEDTHEFGKSSDDTEEDFSEEKRTVLPISANNHLYWHASNLDLPSDALYINMDPKTQKTLKFIIREMIETERDYVKSLDYVIVNFIPEISREDIPQALRGQRNTVFGNVEKIYEFHSQHFLLELEECENNPLQVGQIFLNHDKKFYLYALYNKNKPKSDTLMSEYGTFFFKSKQIELGDKMDLASYLLKPVQRMGKYALLLQQLMKACPTPEDERPPPEFEDLKSAEEMVRFQLRHGNDLLAMDSIRECDVNLKEQGRLLRQNEFLVWEGRTGKKSLRQVFLFEELILFSKAKRFPDNKNLDLYYYKNSIKMTDIGLTPKISDSSTKFEIWFRKMKPNDTFTLQSMSLEVKKLWTEELSQLLWKQAIRNRAARLQEMSSMGIGNKPCLDIKPSVDQISHRSISFAQLNKSAPRFRNSIAGPAPETCRNVKRPHSVISMSSMSSGSSSSGASGSAHNGLGHSTSCESTCESPKPYHRSATLNSQCSMESGILADMSVVSDDL